MLGEARAARSRAPRAAASRDALLARLTTREQQVLERIVAGRLNKQIADDLGIIDQDGGGAPRQHHGQAQRQHGGRSDAHRVGAEADCGSSNSRAGKLRALSLSCGRLTGMTARIIDGKALAASIRSEPARPHRAPRPRRASARARGGAGRRRSGLCRLRAQQGPGLRGRRHPFVADRLAGQTPRERPARAYRRTERRSGRARHPGADCRCRGTSTRSEIVEAIAFDKDVDGLHAINAG